MEDNISNLTQGATELAKNSSLSFNLDGWPAAAVLMTFTISLSAVTIYAIKALA